jgi:hypothetical protein
VNQRTDLSAGNRKTAQHGAEHDYQSENDQHPLISFNNEIFWGSGTVAIRSRQRAHIPISSIGHSARSRNLPAHLAE